MKKMLKNIKDKFEAAIKESIKNFMFQKDIEESRLRKRLRSLDVPVMKTHMAELDSTFTNEADGSEERIKTLNHAIERCFEARDRLKKGTYGICKECGSEIPLKRLLGSKGVPFTRHCVPCKTEMETSWKQRGNPKAPRQTFHA